MPQAVDSSTRELEQLSAQLRDLERRVAALEGQSEVAPPAQSQEADSLSAASQTTKAPEVAPATPAIEIPTGAVQVLGKAVLGIAGAYLLRAIAEAGPIPQLPVLIVAIVYAASWMVGAVRAHDTNRFASATYGVTSVLILAPLLWESTVRFRVISPIFTAVVLVAFMVLESMLSWRRRLQVIPWVVTISAVITALALIIATHDLVPLTATMLAVAGITEMAAYLEPRLGLRGVMAVAVDLAIWLFIALMTSAGGVPEGYRPTSLLTTSVLCLALLVIYGGSIAVRGFALRQRLSIFEIGQGVVAFMLATFGVLRATQGSASVALGMLSMVLSGAMYWGALSHFADELHSRNRRASATWAAALLLAASFLVFRGSLQVLFLCLAALAGAFLYSHTRKFSLGLHASAYLGAATAVSALPAYVGNALAGSVPSAPGWNVWIVAVAAILCYFLGARVLEDRSGRRLLWVIPAMLVAFACAATMVVVISRISAGRMELTPSRLSVVRTIVNCVLALTLAFAGSRRKHVELAWLAYAAVVFGTLKLLLEDLRFGNPASLMISLLCYGSALILLPRLTRQAATKY